AFDGSHLTRRPVFDGSLGESEEESVISSSIEWLRDLLLFYKVRGPGKKTLFDYLKRLNPRQVLEQIKGPDTDIRLFDLSGVIAAAIAFLSTPPVFQLFLFLILGGLFFAWLTSRLSKEVELPVQIKNFREEILPAVWQPRGHLYGSEILEGVERKDSRSYDVKADAPIDVLPQERQVVYGYFYSRFFQHNAQRYHPDIRQRQGQLYAVRTIQGYSNRGILELFKRLQTFGFFAAPPQGPPVSQVNHRRHSRGNALLGALIALLFLSFALAVGIALFKSGLISPLVGFGILVAMGLALALAYPQFMSRVFFLGSNMIGRIVAGTLLVTLVPVFLTVAATLKISGSDILFGQKRVGLHGRTIRIFKFKTMTDDKKITRVGWWLRKSRLDETPQLISVVKGDMSWFGPRPHQEDEISDRYREIVLSRRSPGLFSGVALQGVVLDWLEGFSHSSSEKVRVGASYWLTLLLDRWLDPTTLSEIDRMEWATRFVHIEGANGLGALLKERLERSKGAEKVATTSRRWQVSVDLSGLSVAAQELEEVPFLEIILIVMGALAAISLGRFIFLRVKQALSRRKPRRRQHSKERINRGRRNMLGVLLGGALETVAREAAAQVPLRDAGIETSQIEAAQTWLTSFISNDLDGNSQEPNPDDPLFHAYTSYRSFTYNRVQSELNRDAHDRVVKIASLIDLLVDEKEKIRVFLGYALAQYIRELQKARQERQYAEKSEKINQDLRVLALRVSSDLHVRIMAVTDLANKAIDKKEDPLQKSSSALQSAVQALYAYLVPRTFYIDIEIHKNGPWHLYMKSFELRPEKVRMGDQEILISIGEAIDEIKIEKFMAHPIDGYSETIVLMDKIKRVEMVDVQHALQRGEGAQYSTAVGLNPRQQSDLQRLRKVTARLTQKSFLGKSSVELMNQLIGLAKIEAARHAADREKKFANDVKEARAFLTEIMHAFVENPSYVYYVFAKWSEFIFSPPLARAKGARQVFIQLMRIVLDRGWSKRQFGKDVKDIFKGDVAFTELVQALEMLEKFSPEQVRTLADVVWKETQSDGGYLGGITLEEARRQVRSYEEQKLVTRLEEPLVQEALNEVLRHFGLSGSQEIFVIETEEVTFGATALPETSAIYFQRPFLNRLLQSSNARTRLVRVFIHELNGKSHMRNRLAEWEYSFRQILKIFQKDRRHERVNTDALPGMSRRKFLEVTPRVVAVAPLAVPLIMQVPFRALAQELAFLGDAPDASLSGSSDDFRLEKDAKVLLTIFLRDEVQGQGGTEPTLDNPLFTTFMRLRTQLYEGIRKNMGIDSDNHTVKEVALIELLDDMREKVRIFLSYSLSAYSLAIQEALDSPDYKDQRARLNNEILRVAQRLGKDFYEKFRALIEEGMRYIDQNHPEKLLAVFQNVSGAFNDLLFKHQFHLMANRRGVVLVVSGAEVNYLYLKSYEIKEKLEIALPVSEKPIAVYLAHPMDDIPRWNVGGWHEAQKDYAFVFVDIMQDAVADVQEVLTDGGKSLFGEDENDTPLKKRFREQYVALIRKEFLGKTPAEILRKIIENVAVHEALHVAERALKQDTATQEEHAFEAELAGGGQPERGSPYYSLTQWALHIFNPTRKEYTEAARRGFASSLIQAQADKLIDREVAWKAEQIRKDPLPIEHIADILEWFGAFSRVQISEVARKLLMRQMTARRNPYSEITIAEDVHQEYVAQFNTEGEILPMTIMRDDRGFSITNVPYAARLDWIKIIRKILGDLHITVHASATALKRIREFKIVVTTDRKELSEYEGGPIHIATVDIANKIIYVHPAFFNSGLTFLKQLEIIYHELFSHMAHNQYDEALAQEDTRRFMATGTEMDTLDESVEDSSPSVNLSFEPPSNGLKTWDVGEVYARLDASMVTSRRGRTRMVVEFEGDEDVDIARLQRRKEDAKPGQVVVLDIVRQRMVGDFLVDAFPRYHRIEIQVQEPLGLFTLKLGCGIGMDGEGLPVTYLDCASRTIVRPFQHVVRIYHGDRARVREVQNPTQSAAIIREELRKLRDQGSGGAKLAWYTQLPGSAVPVALQNALEGHPVDRGVVFLGEAPTSEVTNVIVDEVKTSAREQLASPSGTRVMLQAPSANWQHPFEVVRLGAHVFFVPTRVSLPARALESMLRTALGVHDLKSLPSENPYVLMPVAHILSRSATGEVIDHLAANVGGQVVLLHQGLFDSRDGRETGMINRMNDGMEDLGYAFFQMLLEHELKHAVGMDDHEEDLSQDVSRLMQLSQQSIIPLPPAFRVIV
ncbi:MAG: sugar transferase, partial [Candidatus Omnitrophica bacterium]|nr:sugar transferase [Candidatus Omnitrophota bacterium]